jgi:hypothetical protein
VFERNDLRRSGLFARAIGGEAEDLLPCGIERRQRGAGAADKELLSGDKKGPRSGSRLGLRGTQALDRLPGLQGAVYQFRSRLTACRQEVWLPPFSMAAAGNEIGSRDLVRRERSGHFRHPSGSRRID